MSFTPLLYHTFQMVIHKLWNHDCITLLVKTLTIANRLHNTSKYITRYKLWTQHHIQSQLIIIIGPRSPDRGHRIPTQLQSICNSTSNIYFWAYHSITTCLCLQIEIPNTEWQLASKTSVIRVAKIKPTKRFKIWGIYLASAFVCVCHCRFALYYRFYSHCPTSCY